MLPKILATTILRRSNKQWRILCHHALRVRSSPYTGDEMEVTYIKKDARKRAETLALLNQHNNNQQSPPPPPPPPQRAELFGVGDVTSTAATSRSVSTTKKRTVDEDENDTAVLEARFAAVRAANGKERKLSFFELKAIIDMSMFFRHSFLILILYCEFLFLLLFRFERQATYGTERRHHQQQKR